ncbi:MAG: DUF459 domain-containing protein [Candidatus Paceibacterota bacterium]|jgi:hypothetical protein
MEKIIVEPIDFVRKPERKQYRPVVAILLFCLLLSTVAFYNSRKVVLWESQKSEGLNSVFKQGIIAYANASEEVKTKLGWNKFFQNENITWRSLKESPLVFGQPEPAGDLFDGNDFGIANPVQDSGSEPASGQSETDAATSTAEGAATTTTILQGGEKTKDPPPAVSNSGGEKRSSPFRMLIVGDSFVAAGGGLGDPLERMLLNFKDTAVVRQGKVSSGLSRQDYFDWPALAKKLIIQNNPNVGIMMFGSNDNTSIIDSDGKMVASYGSGGWDDQYRKRIDKMLDLFTEAKAEIFVIGVPIMKNKALSSDISHLNSLFKEESGKYANAHFISTWDMLSDSSGNYTEYLLDKDGKQRLSRTADGVHLQYFAGYYVSNAIIEEMGRFLDLKNK